MSLQQKVDKKIHVIDDGEARLEAALRAFDGDLLQRLLDLLKKLDQEGGVFKPTGRNITTVSGFIKEVVAAMRNPQYIDAINDYLARFEQVLQINYSIAETLTGKKVPVSSLVNAELKRIVGELKDTLTNYKNIDRAVRLPIQQQLYRHVVFGSSFVEAESVLRSFFSTNPGKLGHMQRWAGQLAKDALNGFDGAVNWEITKETGLDGFRIVGSLIDTSRQTCRHMVTAPASVTTTSKTGAVTTSGNMFADLAVGPGMYRIADIPIIIARSQGLPGWNPNTTPATYFQYRNGYQCRHQLIPFLLGAAKQKKQVEELN